MSRRMSIRPLEKVVDPSTVEQKTKECFLRGIAALSEDTGTALQHIWKEAGYSPDECQSLLGELFDKVKDVFISEVEAEQSILDHAKLEVEAKIQALQLYNAQLGRACEVAYLNHYNCTEKLTDLEDKICIIQVEVVEREGLLNAEISSIEQLVNVLGEAFPDMDIFSGPRGTPELSDCRLQLMREYKCELEGIQVKRVQDMKGMLEECRTHVSVLSIEDEGFETLADSRKFVSCDALISTYLESSNFLFGTTKDDMIELTKRLKGLATEKERRRKELSDIGAEIASLWTVLRIPSEDRNLFQSSLKQNLSMETLSIGFEELQRLRADRIKSVGKIIAGLRQDIEALWEEFGVIEDETRSQEFPGFYEDVELLQDEAIDEHEEYCASLRARMEQIRPFLQKIQKRETVVKERVELEHIQLNPERLQARGMHAREERKREEAMAGRVKNLDKLTEQLVAALEEWEKENGAFMYAGERYIDRVQHQDTAYTEIKDSLRNARKKNNEQKNESDLKKSDSGTLKRSDSKSSRPQMGAKSTSQSSQGSQSKSTLLSLMSQSQDENNRPCNTHAIQLGCPSTESITFSNLKNKKASGGLLSSAIKQTPTRTGRM